MTEDSWSQEGRSNPRSPDYKAIVVISTPHCTENSNNQSNHSKQRSSAWYGDNLEQTARNKPHVSTPSNGMIAVHRRRASK